MKKSYKYKANKLSIEATGCGWIIIVAVIIFIVAFCTSCNAQCEHQDGVSSSQSRWIMRSDLRSVTPEGSMNYWVRVQFENFNREENINFCDTLLIPVVIPFSLSAEDRLQNIQIIIALNFSKWLQNRDKFKTDLKILQQNSL